MTVLESVLLWLGVAAALSCCVGFALMRSLYERLHYLTGVSAFTMPLAAAAVVLKEGPSQASVKAALAAVLLAAANAALGHATARAARVHELGHWTPGR